MVWLERHPWQTAAVLAVALGAASLKKFLVLDAPDFKVFYTAGTFALTEPLKIYRESPDQFLYPPIATLLFAPLSALAPWEYARWLWYGLSIFIVYLIAKRSIWHTLATIILARYFIINFRYGQVNILILGLMILAAALLQQRRGSLAGVIIAINSALKIFPGVQVIQLILARNYRGLATVVATGLILLALPFVFLESALALELYRDFFSAIALKGVPSHSHNQSLLAFIARFLHWENFYAFPVDYAWWRLTIVPFGYLRLSAFIIGASLCVLFFHKAVKRGLPDDLLSATMLSIIFLSHIVWKPYFALLLPVVAQVLQGKGKFHWFFFAGFICFGPLLSADIYGFKISAWMDGACTHLFAALLLTIAWLRMPTIEPASKTKL